MVPRISSFCPPSFHRGRKCLLSTPGIRPFSEHHQPPQPPQNHQWPKPQPFPPPLRILFCGSDHFSATSLKALQQEHLRNPGFIGSIDVICKKDKHSGRGMKTLREVPIKSVATELDLPIHEIKSFTGWQLPIQPYTPPINLIIAVSFGLLIPVRILSSVFYGGINVHPSLLPSFRGPAPLYHALLNNATFTGVTVQTLHPTKFDHGAILLQSPEIPIPQGTSYTALHDQLAVLGAHMLIHTCRHRLFSPPINHIESPYPPSEAPKIHPDNSKIDWKNQSARVIERYCGVLRTLWCRLGDSQELVRRKRVIFSSIEAWDEDAVTLEDTKEPMPPGKWIYYETEPHLGVLLVKTKNGWINVGGIKIEGKTLTHGGEWARSMAAHNKGPFCFT